MRRTVLVLVVLFSAVSLAAAPVRLSRDVVPLSESITLRLDPRADTYSGRVVIELDVKKKTPSFSLHAEEMTLEKVTVGAADAKVEKGPENTVVITPSSALEIGRTTMTIDFQNDYDRRAVGLYKMVRKDEPYLFTQFESIDARKAFPCWDEPGFKIPYQLTASVPAQYEVLFNTPVADQSESDGWKTVRFAQTKPLPSYLLAIAAGALELTPVPGTSIPTRIVTVKGQKALTGIAVEQTPKLLAALEKYFDSKYPFEKLDLIAVPEYWFGAMENPGLITYAENILLMDSRSATPQQRSTNARVTAHELAHMWFGDLVTMSWWDDLWLNESFADWMGDKITDQVYPEYGTAAAELRSVQGIMNVDASPLTQAIRNRNTTPDEAMRSVGVAYNKGKAVISMFERWLGPDQFRAGVIKHLKAHAWGNATASDFWSALGKHTAAPMETFIDQPGLPLVNVEITGANTVKLSQTRYLRSGITAAAEQWIVPVALRYSDGKKSSVKTVLLDAPSKTVTLDGPKIEWVYPHADAVGYYRWQMPAAQFTKLAEHATEGLTADERIAFLGNLNALLDAGVVHGNDLLDILQRFSSETDPQVLGSIFASIGKVGYALDEKDRPLFAAYVRRTLGPVVERVGRARKPGEPQTVTMLRPQLLSIAAIVGEDPDTIAFAKELAAKYMADPSSVDPTLGGFALAVAARTGDDALFETYRAHFESATVPAERSRYLGALGSFRDKTIREKALAYALNGPIRPNEIFAIPAGYLDTEEGRAYMFDWFLKNYDAIATKVPAPFRAGMPRIVAGGCDASRLAKTKEFFFTPERKVEGMEREMARTEEQVKECVAFRAREAATIRAYLEKLH